MCGMCGKGLNEKDPKNRNQNGIGGKVERIIRPTIRQWSQAGR